MFTSHPTKQMIVERLKRVYRLYQQTGTLAAVGEEMGLTRERIRQLLLAGSKLGLFDYQPKTLRSPSITKKRLLEDYRIHHRLDRVAKANNTSRYHVKKLLSRYGVTGRDILSIGVAAKRAARREKCIAIYNQLKGELGHHLTATELQRPGKGRPNLGIDIWKLWGSIHAFRKELNIQMPTDRAVRKERCIAFYNQLKAELGHHPRWSELNRSSKVWGNLGIKIYRLWGSIRTFRKELNIRKPPRHSPLRLRRGLRGKNATNKAT